MKKDYKHLIAVLVTVGFVACGIFIFPNAICRLLEAIRDFFVSLAFYFCKLFLDIDFNVTVNDLPSWQLAPSKFHPLDLLPVTWEEFKALLSVYWELFFSKDTFLLYLDFLIDILYYLSQVLSIVYTLLIPCYFLFKAYLSNQNNAYDKESQAVKRFKRLSDLTYHRIKLWLREFIAFLKEHKYLKIWAYLWAFYFNFFTIIAEALAYYFYFIPTFDFISLYRQVYKLLLDLTAVVRFIPGILWVVCVLGILEYWARKAGYNVLNHRELRNCGFINSLGVLTILYGPMGSGKTKTITDMALTEEVRMRDMALEIILESDLKFPNMNWSRLQQKLKKLIRQRRIYSVPSVRRWLAEKYKKWVEKPYLVKIFGYEYERYGLEYNNGLEVQNVWEVIDDYACAYLIYTVQSSLLVVNYSIRSDQLMEDLGNFPLWDSDFFRRDERYLDTFSRYAHILDYDMLRLGKRMLKDNPNRYAFGFGVYVISEIDKERKNALETKYLDPTSEQANQKNDLFNTLLKMSRHACVVANRVFIKIFADLQRPESLGADARELGSVIYIEDPGEMQPSLPFFAPFYVFETLFKVIFGKFKELYLQYQHVRADKTLPLYILKNIVAACDHIRDRTCNRFGTSTAKFLIESGRMDGETKKAKYYLQAKKIYARRYTTDCLSGIFERYAEFNTIGIDDLPTYKTIIASEDELLMQHSFFQVEVNGLRNAA